MNLPSEEEQSMHFYRAIIPIILSVFGVYLTIGIVLGVLPAFVQRRLGYGSIIVGLVTGLQFLSTLLTRAYSGKITDTRGTKRNNRYGMVLAVLAGVGRIISEASPASTGITAVC